MDLATRKYNFIEDIFKIENSTFEKLEKILKKAKAEQSEISTVHKVELDKRLQVYRNDPDNLLDWDEIKDKW